MRSNHVIEQDIATVESSIRALLRFAQGRIPIETQISIGQSTLGPSQALDILEVLLREIPKNYSSGLCRGFRASATDVRLAAGSVFYMHNQMRNSTASSPREISVRSEEYQKSLHVFKAVCAHVSDPKALPSIQRKIRKIRHIDEINFRRHQHLPLGNEADRVHYDGVLDALRSARNEIASRFRIPVRKELPRKTLDNAKAL